MDTAAPGSFTLIMGALLAALTGGVSAWSDCFSEIERHNVQTLSIAMYPRCVLFYALNGVIAVGFYVWAILDPEGWVNKAITADSILFKGLLIGLAVTALLRSSVGTVKNKKLGFVLLYDTVRRDVLEHLITASADAKETIVQIYEQQFLSDPTFIEDLQNYVLEIKRLRGKSFDSETKRQFTSLKRKYAADPGKQPLYHKYVIKVALDYGGIAPVKSWLAKRKARP